MGLFQQLLIKLGALFSYCGGPLILSNILKPRLGMPMTFIMTFAPIVLMIFGTDALFDPSPRPRELSRGDDSDTDDWEARWGILCVRLGLVGAVVTLLLHGYGAWILATTPPRPDHGLYVFGVVVGVPLAVGYVYSARRWLNRARGTQGMFSPIEPS